MSARPMVGGQVEARVDAAIARREALRKRGDLEAIRLVNGAADGLPGLFVDQLGAFLLVQAEESVPFGPALKRLLEQCAPRAIFRRPLVKNLRARRPAELAGELVFALDAKAAPGEVRVRERDCTFLLRLREGYSPGLFLDQRDNRERVAELVRGGRRAVLNTFAYTCSFSVAAAKAGAQTTSVDLSEHYLEWGRTNFTANGLDPAAHEIVRGDALTFLEIAAKKKRRFDVFVLDPPTFSTSKQRGVFQVERNYPELFELAARVAAPGAVLLCSHNQRTFTRAALAIKLRDAARAAGRTIAQLTPFSPPADFPGPDPENPASRGFWVELQ